MIDPQLRDWWTSQQLTKISYQDLSLSGAGVSLRVVLHAFLGLQITWYSKIYGEYEDNVLLLGIDRDIGSQFQKVEYTQKSPIQELCGEIFANSYHEFILTDDLASELGLSFSKSDDFLIKHEEKVKYQISVHDNCFFWIKPVDGDLLGKLMNCILEQHSFYLGQEIDWSAIFPSLFRELLTSGEIEIHSDSSRQWVWIPQLEEHKRFFWPAFWRLTGQGTVLIQNGKAYFRKKTSAGW